MNKYNHFLASFVLLFSLFNKNNSIKEIVFFSLMFGVALDLNQLIGRHLRKPLNHLRTWIEEPAGLLLIGIPMGLALSTIKRDYFFMTVIPYATHIIQDYLTIHDVSPLAPFSNRTIKTGIFRPTSTNAWYDAKRGLLSEKYFIGVVIVIIIIFRIIF